MNSTLLKLFAMIAVAAVNAAAVEKPFVDSLVAGDSALKEGFVNPPNAAKPHTWYHMMNGNVTKEGITRDFEALAKAGVGGVQMFDAGCAIPPGPLKFNSPDWFDLFRHAQKEAKRLGLEICIPNCSGWPSSGAPRLTATETSARRAIRVLRRILRMSGDAAMPRPSRSRRVRRAAAGGARHLIR